MPEGVPVHVARYARILFFFLGCSLGIYSYADPKGAVEAIATIDVTGTEDNLKRVLLPLLLNTSSAPVINTAIFSDTLTVVTKVFASLILVACGGILSRRHLPSRLLVIASQCTALGFFIETAMSDGGILEQAFVINFSIFACGLPALVAGLEAFQLRDD